MAHQTYFHRTGIVVVALVTLAGCGPSAKELQLQSRIDELSVQVRTLEHGRADEAWQLRQKESELAALGASAKSSKADVARLERALAEYETHAKVLANVAERYQNLKRRLEALQQTGVKFVVRDNRMVIELPGDVLFDSGKDALKSNGKTILAEIANVIRNDGDLSKRMFQVAGHTDDAPYPSTGPFRDNWGLSFARARQVLLFLVTPVAEGAPGRGKSERPLGGGLSAQNLSAAAFGDTHPEIGTVGSETEAERKRNRRVELVIQPNVDEMLSLANLD